MFLEIKTCAFSFICAVIYQKPNKGETFQNESFCENLENCFCKIVNKSSERLIVLCSDFNVDLLNGAPNYFKEDMTAFSFVPCITRPTRYKSCSISNSSTLIDHIWVNQANVVSNSAILVDSFDSDHLTISCLLLANQSFFSQNCDWSSPNLHRFTNVVDHISWKKLPNSFSELLEKFKDNVGEAFKKHQVKSFALISWKSYCKRKLNSYVNHI